MSGGGGGRAVVFDFCLSFHVVTKIQRVARDERALEVGMASCDRCTEKMMIRGITREQGLGAGQLEDVRILIVDL
jgi:hypothetical protein